MRRWNRLRARRRRGAERVVRRVGATGLGDLASHQFGLLATRALVAQLQLEVVDAFFGQLAFESLLRLQRSVDPEDCGPRQEDSKKNGEDLQGGLLCVTALDRS